MHVRVVSGMPFQRSALYGCSNPTMKKSDKILFPDTDRRWAKEYGIVLPRKHRFFLTPPSPPDRRHVSTVPVSQWSKDGKFIRLYRSFVDTERYGFSQKAVSKCCHGRPKTYRGFLWKIESNENPSVISSLKGTSGVFEQKSVFEHCDSREVVVPRMDKGTDS